MKRFSFYTLFISILCTVLPFQGFSQSKEQIEKLTEISAQQSRRFAEENAAAVRLADSLGWPVRLELEDGRIIELMRIHRGMPRYYTTLNTEGGSLLNAHRVYPGGGAGLNLTGAGATLGIWDGGGVRHSHQEFMGPDGSRVTQRDAGAGLSNHATHVAGTMVASGTDPAARGMSWRAFLDAYDWHNDASEMATAAANGLQVSQHSYGYINGWHFSSAENTWYWHGDVSISETEDYKFGFYDELAALWDEIAFHAPHYLIVKSAGNDRGRGPEPGTSHRVMENGRWVTSTAVREVDGGEDGFDCMANNSLAKNIITVGAVFSNGDMSPFSGWGPTDDGRVKPDVVAKGVSVYSSLAGSNDSYAIYHGTSMSGPMVSGSVGLILEQQQKLHPGDTLLASTVKALILHGANDLISGAPGPDYRYGWGMMDVEAALTTMGDNQAANGIHIMEKTLNQGDEISIQLRATGREPLRAMMVWTDPPGKPVDPPSLNPVDRMLVNDLDMRVICSTEQTYKPYILDPSRPADAAGTGDNFRDNVEMIHISEPRANEIYTLQIAHKGELDGGSQTFSLVVTGNMDLSGVADPISLEAEPLGEDRIEIAWEPNEDGDPVLVAWTSDNVFGKPDNGVQYLAGDQLPGGGKVLYAGGNSPFMHSELEAATTYYYRAFSQNDAGDYSTGTSAWASTACGLFEITYYEDFNNALYAPACWEVVDHVGNGLVWKFGAHGGGLKGDTDYYAYLNSDLYGPGNTQNSDMISPLFDLSGYEHVVFSFTHYFLQYEGQSEASLYYTLDDGKSWELIEKWTETTENPAHFSRAMPELSGAPAVRFKWNYQGTWAYFWNVDDVSLIGTYVAEPFAAGGGTEENPWQIALPEHLYNIRHFLGDNNQDKHFEQVTHIDLGQAPWNKGHGWIPIGNEEVAFQGTYHGQDHHIEGLHTARPEPHAAGLFGLVRGGSIFDTQIRAGQAESSGPVGLLAGSLEADAVVRNSHVSGYVMGREDPAGGLAGRISQDASIDQSSSQVVVTQEGGDPAGGLAGQLDDGHIRQSFSTGDVRGRYAVGGLVGSMLNQSSISNAYATGHIQAQDVAAALVGEASGGLISHTYAVGHISASAGQTGGLVAVSGDPGVEVHDSYWNVVTTGQEESAGGTPRTSQELLQSAHFENWDFQEVWTMEEDRSYPFFRWQEPPGPSLYPPFMISLEVRPQGSGYAEGGGLYPKEAQVRLYGYPNPGFYFVRWTDAQGEVVSLDQEYVFSMPDKDLSLVAEFEEYEATDQMRLVFDTRLDQGTTVWLDLQGTVNATIDWGDGNSVSVEGAGLRSHTYEAEGEYLVHIGGTLTHFAGARASAHVSGRNLIRVTSFGDIGLSSLENAFNRAVNLVEVPAAFPPGVTNVNRMFFGATAFNQDIGQWDMSGVVHYLHMFNGAESFNRNIGDWDVSRAMNMEYMFYGASAFNQDIGRWDVGRVRSMRNMFGFATAFNQDIGNWDLGNNLSIRGMFIAARSFNQDISHWDVSGIDNMSSVFNGAISFNQDLGRWDVSNVFNMENMFGGVTLSTSNYNSILINWANQSVRNDVTLHAGNSRYSEGLASSARQKLTRNFGWTITDGGPSDVPAYILSLQSDPEEGVTLYGGGQYEKGHRIRVSARGEEGWDFEGWTDQTSQVLSTETDFVFIMPEANASLLASFDVPPTQIVDWGETQAKVFPNPFDASIRIESTTALRNIQLLNFFGQSVRQVDAGTEHLIHLDTTGLPPGIYFLVLETPEGKREVVKMLKR